MSFHTAYTQIAGMGRKLKDLQHYKMSRGQTSPLQMPVSPEEGGPEIKRSRKVPPLKIKIKPADQIHATYRTYLKPKTKKPVLLTEPPVPLQMTDLKMNKGASTDRLPLNAWAKPLLPSSCQGQTTVSDDDLSDHLIIDDDVTDEIYQSDNSCTPITGLAAKLPEIQVDELPPPSKSPTVQGSSTTTRGEKEKKVKQVAWDLSIKNGSQEETRKRPAQPTQSSRASPPTPSAPPSSPADASPTLNCYAGFAHPSSPAKAPATKKPGLINSMQLLENLGKLPSRGEPTTVEKLHEATSSAFGRITDQIQNLSAQLLTIQQQPRATTNSFNNQTDRFPSFASEFIPSIPNQTLWPKQERAATPAVNNWAPSSAAMGSATSTSWSRWSTTMPTSSCYASSPWSPQHLSPRKSVLVDHSKALWNNIQQERILQASQSGPAAISFPQLFEKQYEIAPELKAFGRNHHLASWTLSLQETRRADVIYSFTVRVMAILFEAMRKSPDFGHLQGLDTLDWNVQRTFLSRVLQPFMKVRSLAGLVSFCTDKYGKDDHLTKSMFETWAQFQLSKISHPFCPTSTEHTQYQPNITEALLKFPTKTTNLEKEYFAPLPALPARGQLWNSLTHRLECGRTPVEAMAFLTWISIHDHHLGRALTAPLFETGHFTHTWAFTFEPHHICMAPASPQIETPQVVRILRICAMFIASKVLQVSLINQYPTGINKTGQVFLPLSTTEASKQTFATDLLVNKDQIQLTGWTEGSWNNLFGSQEKINTYYDQLTALKLGSLFHLSRPIGSLSPSTWHDLRPNKDLTAAHQYMVAREKFWETHLLSHAPLNFSESRFSQIVPSQALFWLKNAK